MSFLRNASVIVLACAAIASANVDVTKLTKEPDAWFKSDAGRAVLADIVSWQNADGGWYKEYEADQPRPAVLPNDGKHFGGTSWAASSTIDNGATYSEMRVLARGNRVTPDARLVASFKKGLAYLEAMQYPNGGFPQRFPLPNNYGRQITFNDDAMTNVMRLLKDIAGAKPDGDFAFCDANDRDKAKAVFDRAVECVLNCQVVIDGKPTVWCQQHDAVTLQPTGARAFELPSLCSTESANLTALLMEISTPSPRLKAAIDGAVAWFEKNKIADKKWDWVSGPQYEGGKDRVVHDAPGVSSWARFYDIETGKPFFVARDGIKRWAVTDLARERRIGYAWYSVAPQKVLAAYPGWKAKNER